MSSTSFKDETINAIHRFAKDCSVVSFCIYKPNIVKYVGNSYSQLLDCLSKIGNEVNSNTTSKQWAGYITFDNYSCLVRRSEFTYTKGWNESWELV